MIFKNVLRRLELLESGSSLTDALLTFPDGSTRAVAFRKPLGVFCAAADRCADAGPGLCEGSDQVPHQTESQKGPRPTSEYDAAVDILGRAVSIRSDHRFLHLIHQLAHEVVELEAQKEKENTNGPGTEGLAAERRS